MVISFFNFDIVAKSNRQSKNIAASRALSYLDLTNEFCIDLLGTALTKSFTLTQSSKYKHWSHSLIEEMFTMLLDFNT